MNQTVPAYSDVRAQHCGECGATPGQACKGRGGEERKSHHQTRVISANKQQTTAREHRPYDNEPTPERRPDWCHCQRIDTVVHLCDEHRRIGLEAIAAIKARRTA
jgi:hypothetical protein